MSYDTGSWTSLGEPSLSPPARLGLVGITVCLGLIAASAIFPATPAVPELPPGGAACLDRPDPRCMGELAANLQRREPDQSLADEMAAHLARLGLDGRAVEIAAVVPEDRRRNTEITLVVGRIAAAVRADPARPDDLTALDALDANGRLLGRGRLAAFLMGDPHGEELFRRYSVPDLDLVESMALPPPRQSAPRAVIETLVRDAVREGPVAHEDDPGGARVQAMVSIVRAARILGRDAPLATARALAGPGSALSIMMVGGLGAEYLRADQRPLIASGPGDSATLLMTLSLGDAPEDLRGLAAARAWRASEPLFALHAVRTLAGFSIPSGKAYAVTIARGMATAATGRQEGRPSLALAAAALATVDLLDEARKVLDSGPAPAPSANANELALHVFALRRIGQGVEARAFLEGLPPEVRIGVSVGSAWLMPPGAPRNALLDQEISTQPPLLRRAGMRFSTGTRFMMRGERDEAVRQFVLAYQDSRDDRGTPGAGFNTLLMTARALLAADRPVEAAAAMRRAWTVLPRGGRDTGIYIARYAVLWRDRFPGFDPLRP